MSVSIEVLPFETPGDFHSGGIRHHLARHGTPLGPNDLLIAAHARSLHLTVATAKCARAFVAPRDASAPVRAARTGTQDNPERGIDSRIRPTLGIVRTIKTGGEGGIRMRGYPIDSSGFHIRAPANRPWGWL